MFENIINFFKRFGKNEKENSKNAAKERLHLVLAQDRANISADFLEMMKQEIIEVIKKYIDIDEEAIDVRMTNKPGEDGTVGAPALYANIPIVTIKNEARKLEGTVKNKEVKTEVAEEKENKVDTNQEESKQKEEVEKEAKKEEIKQEEVVKEEKETEKINEEVDEEVAEKENLSDKKDAKEKDNISNAKKEKKENIKEEKNEKKNS